MKLTDLQKLDIVKSYIEGKTRTQLAKEFNVCEGSIRSILKVRKILLRGRRKYFLNESYFDAIDTQEKAYWLGFIYADGNVYKSTLSIKLANKDIGHIEKFREAIGSVHPIKPVSKKDASVLKLSSNKLVDSILKVGVLPNKSLTIQFPTWLSAELVPDFIRGVFDGDGWMTCYKPKDQNKKIWSIGFCSGSEGFIRYIKKEIDSGAGVIGSCYKRKGGYQLQYKGNKPVVAVAGFMYGNDAPSLDRKYEKFKMFKNGLTAGDLPV